MQLANACNQHCRYVFEALCTRQAEANANEEFGVVVATRLGPHRLLMGAEVDCYLPPTSTHSSSSGRASAISNAVSSCGGGSASPGAAGLPSYLELKTYRIPQHRGQQVTLYRHKYAKWWLQSFLAGVPTLGLGGRDDQVGAQGCWVGGCWAAS